MPVLERFRTHPVAGSFARVLRQEPAVTLRAGVRGALWTSDTERIRIAGAVENRGVTACLKQWKLSEEFSHAVVAGDATVFDRVVDVGAAAVSLACVPAHEGGQGWRQSRSDAQRSELRGVVRELARQRVIRQDKATSPQSRR